MAITSIVLLVIRKVTMILIGFWIGHKLTNLIDQKVEKAKKVEITTMGIEIKEHR